MKIVFICGTDINIGYLGVEYISSILKNHGHQVELLVDPIHSSNNIITHVERENVKRVKELKPDLIGFSMVTAQYQWALKMARIIKKGVDTPIIFGGTHPTADPEGVIKNSAVDMVCVGEGEDAMLELVESLERNEKRADIDNIWFKNDEDIIRNGVRPLLHELDTLPFPDKELFVEKLGTACVSRYMIIATRGCAFTCTYCFNNSNRELYRKKGKYVRKRSVDNVVSELVRARERYPIKRVTFADDHFTDNVRWLEEFTEKYKKFIDIPFVICSHVNFMDERRAELLKKAGCWLLLLGLQSGSEYLRNTILKRNESNERVRDVARACHQAGLKFSIDLIFNLPYETEEHLFETVNLMNELRPNIVNTYSLFYLPGTEIIQQAKRAGMIDERIIGKIMEGTYGNSINPPPAKRSYRKFYMVLTLMPLLPKRVMYYIIGSKTFLSFLEMVPIPVQRLVKMIAHLRAGSFHMLKEAILATLQLHFKK
jgi:anaerobic magnesium-protoporphyrin IX monomethyl ester cyclase